MKIAANLIYKVKSKKNTWRLTTGDFMFVLFFIITMLAKNYYFQFSAKLLTSFFSPSNKLVFLSTLAVLISYSILIVCVFNKYRKGAIIVSNLLFSIIIFSDTLYFRYFHEAITILDLFLISLTGSVGESVKSILVPQDFLLFIDIPFWFLLEKTLNSKFTGIRKHISRKAMVFILTVVIGFMTFYFTNRQISAKAEPYDDNYIISSQGLLYFHYYDMKRFVDENFLRDTELTEEERKIITDFYNGRQKEGNKFFGVAKGRNVIIVQMEAIQNFVINLKIDGKEVTPNLNKLVNDFVYFDKFFYQVAGGNTSDAEFMCNNSLYPADNGSVYFRFPENTFISLPSLLKKNGYQTGAFHAFKREYWNRDDFYETIKFDSYFSREDYDESKILGWGLPDREFFKQSLELMNFEKPFYSFLITLSSHHPFNHFDGFGEFSAGEYEGTLAGNYLKAANYVDYAIGEFINDLKKRGLYEDSIIVLYGDHGAIQKEEAELVEKLLNIDINEPEWRKLQRVPLFIRWPGMDATGVNHTVGGQIDIYPTVGNLLGIKTPFAMGKDLFNTKRGYAVFRNYDVVTDDYIYIKAEDMIYDWNGNEIDMEKHVNEISWLQKELGVSDTILENDAFINIDIESIKSALDN